MTDEPPQKVVRRRRGPFKRSRTGCGTCKRRGKKCDEMWSPEGFCQRCLAGPWECSGRTAGPERNTSSDSVPIVGNGIGSSSSGTTSVHPLPAVTHVVAPATASGMPPTAWGLGSSRSDSGTSAMATSPLATSAPLHAPSAGPSASSVSTASTHLAVHTPVDSLNTGLWNGYLTPEDATRPFQNQFTPLFDWPGAHAGMPSAVLTTCPDGTLAIDTPTFGSGMDSGVADFWNDLSASFGGSNPNSQTTFNPASSRGVSLAEIYARVVESWLVGLPGQMRDYVRARIVALHDTNNVMRAVRYAVAAAYIFLFASDSQGNDHPKPTLVELACRGAGMLQPGSSAATGARSGSSEERRMSKGSEGGTTAGDDGDDEGGPSRAFKKIRLYVDHVSTPFAADLESTKWTEDAVTELRQVVVKDQSQLSDLLWGVIDLQLVEFIRGGAAPSYNMLALGDRLVRSVFGCEHPPITLSELRKPQTFSLRLYALSDISRCIVQRGRRTIFNFWTSQATPVPSEEDEPWSLYLGLPDTIVIHLAEVVNLCAELHLQGSMTPAIKKQADEIEAALRKWTAPATQVVNTESSAFVSRAIAGEIWRLTALICLYQSVHRVGGLHPVLRRASSEILSLLGSVTQLPNGDLWGFIAFPAFLVATLSTDEADRKRAMTFLVRVGPERVWLDNIALVEKIWEEIDETGHMVDWHEKMIREGLSVAFF